MGKHRAHGIAERLMRTLKQRPVCPSVPVLPAHSGEHKGLHRAAPPGLAPALTRHTSRPSSQKPRCHAAIFICQTTMALDGVACNRRKGGSLRLSPISITSTRNLDIDLLRPGKVTFNQKRLNVPREALPDEESGQALVKSDKPCSEPGGRRFETRSLRIIDSTCSPGPQRYVVWCSHRRHRGMNAGV